MNECPCCRKPHCPRERELENHKTSHRAQTIIGGAMIRGMVKATDELEALREKLAVVEKERDYFAEQSKVAQKLVGTYRDRAERLRAVLEFYSSEGNYDSWAEHLGIAGIPVERDRGYRARQALAADRDTDEQGGEHE